MPFCPKCRKEYRAGKQSCYYCQTALVEQLPPENEGTPLRRAKAVSRHLRIEHDYRSTLPLPLGEPEFPETVASFFSVEEGLQAQSALESHGIKCIYRQYKPTDITPSILGKKVVANLQVKRGDVAAAYAVLKAAGNLPENKRAICPQCASADIAKSILSANWKCKSCGFSWRPGKENQE
jgi:hypothetical protein